MGDEVIESMMLVLKGLVVIGVSFLLGGLPLIQSFTLLLTGKNLAKLGTGNVSVSAAFYHGGQIAGIAAVVSEAAKGIGAVLWARFLLPEIIPGEIMALIALVMGRYWLGRGAGTTNVTWGVLAHNGVVAGLVGLISLVSFTIIRERKWGQYGVLVLFPVMQILLYPERKGLAIASITLSLTLAWIYQHLPDDLDLSGDNAQPSTQTMFQFFQGDKSALSLNQPLNPREVGEKAANLAYLKKLGYPVPPGWVLLPGDDPQPLVTSLNPSPEHPFVVRSSAISEDTLHSSGAGQYTSLLNITTPGDLDQAIIRCFQSVDNPQAIAYRQTRQLADTQIAVLIQKQIPGRFSGVAFSRDPIARTGDTVVIEALPGAAIQVVSGQVNPESYQVLVVETNGELTTQILAGAGEVPSDLIHQVAQLARQIETEYHGIPQDIEWTYDGEKIWILQARPITTLLPIWTRKIASEVIPGFIHPLTWSINQPLTCGVWRDLFAVVLGKKIANLDLNQLATLHHSVAYFNASLLGEIFLSMGLPSESLEFLTRGAQFKKPPLQSTLKQLPGLWRLGQREWRLEEDFSREDAAWFTPTLTQLKSESPTTSVAWLERIDLILETLRRVTYYSILVPLSLALRQGILRVAEGDLDNSVMPEVAAVQALQEVANSARHLLPHLEEEMPETLLGRLSELPDGQTILEQLNEFMEEYGYLSEVATDISVPRWREHPRMIRDRFLQGLHHSLGDRRKSFPKRLKVQIVQARLALKGRVTQVYSQLLAHLRWSFLALEQQWRAQEIIWAEGDIFFLTLPEVRSQILEPTQSPERLHQAIATRQQQWQQHQQAQSIPYIVYGNDPPPMLNPLAPLPGGQKLQGIGASPGKAEGRVKIIPTWENLPEIDASTILVVPYTDSGWSFLLAKAGGLIAEVGGKLSHGAILAREYGIPAVMDIPHIQQRVHEGQWVRIDGTTGTVEIIPLE